MPCRTLEFCLLTRVHASALLTIRHSYLQAISSLRAALSGAADDQGITSATGGPNMTPVNSDAMTFARSPAQVSVAC